MIQIDGVPMLVRMQRLLHSVTANAYVIAARQKYAALGVTAIPDRWDGQGPLAGIITAMLTTGETDPAVEWNLIVGCDMPFVTEHWLTYLVDRALVSRAEVVAPRSPQGLEPLCACWRGRAAPKLQTAFDGGVRKITEAMKRLDMEVVDEADWKRFDTSGRLFWNMNTVADYDEAKRILEAQRT
jgi:molybdopterin-guanine dinucleotide biosynthesis protein A